MNRTIVTPAPARTDVTDVGSVAEVDVSDVTEVDLAAATPAVEAGVGPNIDPGVDPGVDDGAGPAVDAGFVRRRGAVLAGGSLLWAVSTLTVGANPATSLGETLQDLTGLAFQVGVMALLSVQARTLAMGSGRITRRMIPVERVVLGLAMVWSAIHGLVPAWRDETWLAILDICWPLSMLGMFVIGIKVALAGRWRGAARLWPLVAESWAVVTVPSFVILGSAVADVVGGTHLLIGYVTLGLILVRRPELVLPRR